MLFFASKHPALDACVCLGAYSGPLPSAKNSTAPFFRSLFGLNASFNRLTGAIPADWARVAFFGSPYLQDVFGTNGTYYPSSSSGALRKADYFFDVRSNALGGTLPAFVWANVSALLRPAVRTEARCPYSLVQIPCQPAHAPLLELHPDDRTGVRCPTF